MTKAQTPLVSICCLVYNHAPYLRECFDGFLAQRTDFPVEILVHDDASTDNSADIIGEYAARRPDLFKPLYQSENQFSKGIVQMSIHFQFPRATGKYVALCEGDDYWCAPEKLQRQVDWLESHPECGLVYSQVQWYFDREKRFDRNWGGPGAGETTLERLLEGNCIPTPSIVIRRDLLDRYIAEVRPQERSWMMGDYPMWLYAAAHSKIRFIDEPLAVYRILNESASHFRSFEQADRFCRSTLDIRRFFAGQYAPQLLPGIEEHSLWERFGFAVQYRNPQAAFALYDAIRQSGVRFDTREHRALRRRTLRMIWRHPILWFTRK